MKKRILSLLVALLLLAGLFGCGKKETEPEPTPTPEVTEDPHAGQVEVTNGAGGTIWVDEAKELELFPMDRYSFTVRDGRVTYGKEGWSLIHGIDVSEFQDEIDWEAVAASGVEFAIVRVGYRGFSEGIMYPDANYEQNIRGAQAAGLKVGAYFFSQAVSEFEAAEEAVYTANLLKGYTLELPVFFDWENIGTQAARTDDVDAATLTGATLEYCRLMELAGFEAGVYSYIPAVYYKYHLDDLKGMTVWMGDPGTWPEFYYDHSIWQYSFTGTVPGIEVDTDLDVMYVAAPVSAGETESAP